MEFGPEIKVSGRPDWLKPSDMVCPAWGTPAYWYPRGDPDAREFAAVGSVADWHNVTVISLPADHPHYAREFKVGDYVVALVSSDVVSKGETRRIDDLEVFQLNDGPRRYRPATPAEIAEYLAEHALEAQYKGEPLPGVWVDPDDASELDAEWFDKAVRSEGIPNAETIAAMQEPRGQSFATVAELMDDLNDAVRLNKVRRQEAEDHNWDIATLIDFGLLADATDIERFEQHHGGLDNNQRDIAEAAIKWARGNS